MTKKIEDGGLAYPGKRWQQVGTVADHGFSDDDSPTYDYVDHPGMSLRDHFAGKVLASVDWSGRDVASFSDEDLQKMAGQIYRISDAMISVKGGK